LQLVAGQNAHLLHGFQEQGVQLNPLELQLQSGVGLGEHEPGQEQHQREQTRRT